MREENKNKYQSEETTLFSDEKGKRHDGLCKNMDFETLFEGCNLKLNLFFVTKLQQTKLSFMNSFPLKPEHSTLGILAHSVAAIQFQLLQFGSSLVRHEDLCCARAATPAQTPSGSLHICEEFSHSLRLISVARCSI